VTDLDKAKELYWKYSCQWVWLVKDGLYDDFIDLGDETMDRWRAEYIANNLENLKTDTRASLHHLVSADAHEALGDLMAFNTYEDDYEKFWHADALYRLASLRRAEKKLVIPAKTKAEQLWKEILDKPSGITNEHRKDIRPNLEGLDAETEEEYLRKYSLRMLGRLRDAAGAPDVQG
jgi:hypothetical protein